MTTFDRRLPYPDCMKQLLVTNAVGTLNLLEATRQSCPQSSFVHLSTNKEYGDRPNSVALKELDSRWDNTPRKRTTEVLNEIAA